ncbi:MAG TPA: GTP-binding protein, partial [Desulfobacterales bacterium]|nr:GTP-binding protein [Desulfobacterales bacterium]
MEKKPEILRNVALIAHGGSGKTSLGEAMLFNSKATNRLCKVDEGNSNFDFEPEEIARKISISTAVYQCEWKKHLINIIDTPGDDNFLSDTKLSLQAADAAILLVDATSGVKVGTEKVWTFAEEQGLPKILFVNKLDRERADFYKALDQISQVFEVNITPVFLPIGKEADFTGIVDLIRMKAYVYQRDGSGKFEPTEIPADMIDEAAEWRERMIENIVEADDELMEKYLE